MILFKITFRNILRNRRRSLMTMMSIAMGVIALLLFGAFSAHTMLSLQTSTVQRLGHLTVFRTGYFDFGAGNPGAYGIADYENLLAMIKTDAVLGPMSQVVTPVVVLGGIAGNFAIDRSKVFFGTGVEPADKDRMMQWDEYHVVDGLWRRRGELGSGLSNTDINQGVVGMGLARILGICRQLDLPNCPRPPIENKPSTAKNAQISLLTDLVRSEDNLETQTAESEWPRLDLLAATAGGAPNVVSIFPHRAIYGGMKEVDDALVLMNIKLAQELVYGRGEPMVTGIVLQFQRTEDMGPARARLNQLIKEKGLDLEVRDFTELLPLYQQALGMLAAIFTFIAVIIGVIVMFTVVNTMSMSVMERFNEIGTSRAMGVRRSGIRWQFVAEGWMLGVFGASIGVVLCLVIGTLINHAGLTWTPPGQASAVPLDVLLAGNTGMIGGTWIGLVVIAILAALVPANKAAKLQVVDALRHV
jgi:putative ABC transport system permease protein